MILPTEALTDHHSSWNLQRLVDHKFQVIGRRFSVWTSDVIIDSLKKVREEWPNTLFHVDAARLTVWKTKGAIINNSTSKQLAEILRGINVNDEDIIEVLDEAKRVADLGLSDVRALSYNYLVCHVFLLPAEPL
jgi:hypothetical protein